MIAKIRKLPVAATLRYEVLNENTQKGRFVVTPGRNGIPTSGAVYFIVDEEGRQPHLQKIGKTDNAEGLKGRMKDYEKLSGGIDATPNLYYRMMTDPLRGRSFSVHYVTFERRETIEVLGQATEVLYTAHHFIESALRKQVDELRAGSEQNKKTYPLWLERGMYQP